MSLDKKIFQIMEEVSPVKKDGNNTFHKYKYAKAEDVIQEIRPLLLKYNLRLKQNTLERTREGELTALKIQFILIDTESGEKDATDYVGEGKDSNDKGAYKAYTGALKYFLRDTFMIPFGDDPEDNPTGGRQNLMAPAKNQPKKTQKMAETPADRFVRLAKKRGLTEKQQKAIMFALTGKIEKFDLADFFDAAKILEKSSKEEIEQLIKDAVAAKQGGKK